MLDVETLGAALKLVKEGGGGGGEGGAVIDDSKISSSTTWSSQKIVDTLCPPFTASGSVVQCTPVENSPLDVQVEIEPLQEGTGDPSPDNVRPIVGWDAVIIWRGGNNMLDMDEITISTVAVYGLEMEKTGNYIRIHGTSTVTEISSFIIAYTNQNYLCGKGFVFSWFTNEPSVIFVYGLRTVSEKAIAIQMNLQEGQVYDFTIQIALGVQKLTAHEPYRGQTYTVQLGQTVYGGNVNLKTGKFVQTHNIIDMGNLTWTYNTTTWGKPIFYANIPDKEPGNIPMLSSVYKFSETQDPSQLGLYEYEGYKSSKTIYIHDDRYTSKEEFKEAITGTLLVYKLEAPLEHDIVDDNLTILAISGTNTICSNSGAVTVSGLSDTVETFNALENRIAALEEAAISG